MLNNYNDVYFNDMFKALENINSFYNIIKSDIINNNRVEDELLVYFLNYDIIYYYDDLYDFFEYIIDYMENNKLNEYYKKNIIKIYEILNEIHESFDFYFIKYMIEENIYEYFFGILYWSIKEIDDLFYYIYYKIILDINY